MSVFEKSFDGVPRDQLERIAREALANWKLANENLSRVQERCNELLEETRDLKKQLLERIRET
jgi:hypothetical protein